jgi:signal transduction histidine kinase
MSLLPRSLFSRLVLVLLGGLVTAQLLSFAIHMHERGELLMEATGIQSAQRIADIVRLLDTTGPAERERIASILSAPPMTVRLNQPLVDVEQNPDNKAQAALFGAFLQRDLGKTWPIQVAVKESPSSPGPGMHGMRSASIGAHSLGRAMQMQPGMQYLSRPSYAFIAQVRLHDGSLVTFDSRQPGETVNWPYRMLLSLAVLLAAVVFVSLIAVRWATRPLNVLADAAEELGKNINRPPLRESGPLEVSRAARAFNRMQALLIRYIQDRTRIFAAMSHDLKTPITRLRLRAELLDDPHLRKQFTRDLGEMEALVKTALDYMRGTNEEELAQPVDMEAMLESLQQNLQETGATVVIEGRPLKPYWGKPQALKRCLANLMENATKYGKSARILVSDNDERIEIRIEDEGPGIPEAELQRVFEPFYRVEGSRSRDTGGTGLGLSIARNVVEAHGGTLSLSNRAAGGLVALLSLPRTFAGQSDDRVPVGART